MNVLSVGTQPRVGAGFRLQWEPVQDCHVLLYPEGMVKLNGSAGEIMKRCNGERNVSGIVADIEETHSIAGVESDVMAFIEMAAKQRWLVWD